MSDDDTPEPDLPTERPLPLLVHVLGWYGMCAVLGMYLLNSYDLIDDQSVPYQLFNVTGAAGVGLLCWRRRAWPAFWLEAAWTLIGIGALIRFVL